MTRSRRPAGIVAAMLAAALLTSGCEVGEGAWDVTEVPEEERYGGTAVVGSFGDLQPLLRFVSSDYDTNMIQREMLFMPLVKLDEEVNPVPWLAERWDTARVAEDTLEVTFHLRRDIFWHDGEQTTAHDVAFTYERLQHPETGFPNPAYFQYYSPESEVVDDHTIRFRLRAHAEFLEPWYLTPAMPRHLLEDAAPAEMMTHPFGQSPVGNGPFRFLRRVPGQEVVFEATDEFPEALGGRPYLDRVVWRYIPEPTTLLTGLLTGRLDYYTGPIPEQAAQIEASDNATLIDFPFRQWVYIAWNTRLPQFEDPRVRRALTMAINRQEIVDGLVYGYGEVGRGTVWPAHWAYDGDDPGTYLPHDPEAARELLAEAGWVQDEDGILRDTNGIAFRFDLMTNQGNDTREQIIQYVQAQLRPLGIQVRPRLREWTSMLDQLRGSLGGEGERTRDFDAVVSSWVDAFRKDDHDQLHCRAMNEPYQYVGYCDEAVSRLIDTVAVLADREEARPFWREYDRLVAQEAPYTVLYYPQRLAGLSRRMQNVEMDTRGELINVQEWWIAPQHR